MENGVEYTVQADGYGASAEDVSLEEVVILSEINGEAVTCAVDFTGCYRLKRAVLPDSVREIYNAFEGCYLLASVEFGSGLKWIDADAFSGCVSLESVLLPDGVTKIGAGAFFRCDALKDVSLPLSLAEIGDEAFSRCLRLSAVTFRGTKAQWEQVGKGTDCFPAGTVIHCTDGDIGIS